MFSIVGNPTVEPFLGPASKVLQPQFVDVCMQLNLPVDTADPSPVAKRSAIRDTHALGLQAGTCLVLFALFWLVYASMLVSPTLAIDDEYAALRTDPTIWVRQSRWVNYLIERFLVPQPVVVYFPLVVFGALASLAYTWLLRAHGLPLEDIRSRLLFVPFVAFPTVLLLVVFKANAIGFGVGLAVACRFMLLAREFLVAWPGSRSRSPAGQPLTQLGLAVICVAVAVGSYQSLLLLTIAGLAGVVLSLTWDDRQGRAHWLPLLLLVASILVGALVSELMSYLIRWWYSVPLQYIDRFFDPGQLLRNPWTVLQHALGDMVLTYGGLANKYAVAFWSIPLVMLSMGAGLVADMRRDPGKAIRAAAMLAFIMAVPFALHLVRGGGMPSRSLVAVPYVIWIAGVLACYQRSRMLKNLGIAAVLLLSIQCLYTVSAYQTNRNLSYQHDVQLAGQLFARISEIVPDFDRTRRYRIHSEGSQAFQSIYPAPGGSTFRISFFEHERRAAGRVAAFMRIHGYSNLDPIGRHRADAFRAHLEQMPVWPAPGSVRYQDGTILVRWGP